MKTRALLAVTCLMLGLATNVLGTVMTFQFTGNLFQVSGDNGLTVGEPFSGAFSYTLEQMGVNVPLGIPGEETRYVLDQYTLTIAGQTLTLAGGHLDVSNDQWPWVDRPDIRWDGLNFGFGQNYGTPLMCGLNGTAVIGLGFTLVNTAGEPFANTLLPTTLDLSYFQSSNYVDITFGNNAGSASGHLASLQVVPEPSSPALLALSVIGLGAGRRFGRSLTPRQSAI